MHKSTSNPGIRIISFLFITSLLIACSQQDKAEFQADPPIVSAPLIIHPDSINIEGDMGTFTLEKISSLLEEHLQLITFTFKSERPSYLNPVSLKIKFPSIDIYGYWNPTMAVDKVNYYRSSFDSKASRYAPVLSFYNVGLQNRICLSLSDAQDKVHFSSYLKEEDVCFYPTIKLFDEKMPATKEYSITLRIDTRPLPYYQVIDDVASWWASNGNYTPMHVPDGARKPMYSSWYSYHQHISAEAIVAECKIAKSLGCEAVIVDDGWQTLDGSRGYAYTGDWVPERIPDMKGFVQAVHDEGMQFILWYSLPFMGERAKNFATFKGKYLRHWESQGTYVLDPRYPEVREYIINTYIQAMQEWNLDGFKLDFIGFFSADNNTELTKENGRDYASVNVATNVLMTEISRSLAELKPDILIEFRQPYIGPMMRKYGNMFRGVDAPNNAVANRLETTNLRILSQNTAVHSDMFIWRVEETPERAALQILNILYSVPQLSVRLEEIPKDHLEMIRFWFSYWNDHREILLDGDFIPSNPGANYPILSAIKDDHQITTIYENMVVDVNGGIKALDIINARANTDVSIRFEEAFDGQVIIKDCKGVVVFEKDVNYRKGISSIEIPMSGLAFLKREK